MSKQYDSVALAGRILIGVLFLMSGLSKLADPAPPKATSPRSVCRPLSSPSRWPLLSKPLAAPC